MPINVTCSQCGTTLRAPDTAAGKKVKCPKCATILPVPAPEPPPAEEVVAVVESPAPPLPVPRSDAIEDDDRPRRPRRDDDDDDDREARRWRRRDEEAAATSSSSNGICMGLGIGSICLGVIAGIFAFIPCCGAVVAWPAGGIGLLIGLIGVLVALLAKQKSVGALILTIAGSVVNVGAIAIALIWVIWFGAMASTTSQQLEKAAKQMEQQQKQRNEQINKQPVEGPLNDDERKTATDRFKQVGLALLSYNDALNTLPPPRWSQAPKKGKFSWRVAILPYIEQGELYNKFKFDEDWNSPHNRGVLENNPMPPQFAPLRVKPGEDRKTYVQYFVGQNTCFPKPDDTLRLPMITDGTSNTLLVAEAKNAVNWTEPADNNIRPGQPPELGGVHGGDFFALAGDGTVYFLRKNQFPEQQLRWLIDPRDGMVIPGWPPPR